MEYKDNKGGLEAQNKGEQKSASKSKLLSSSHIAFEEISGNQFKTILKMLGPRAAFEHLFLTYEAKLTLHITRKLSLYGCDDPASHAKDVADSVWDKMETVIEEVWKGQHPDIWNPLGFLKEIANKLCINHIKSDKKTLVSTEITEAAGEKIENSIDRPDYIYEKKEQQQILLQYFDEFNETVRYTARRRLDDIDFETIARELALNTGAVKVQYYRACHKIGRKFNNGDKNSGGKEV